MAPYLWPVGGLRVFKIIKKMFSEHEDVQVVGETSQEAPSHFCKAGIYMEFMYLWILDRGFERQVCSIGCCEQWIDGRACLQQHTGVFQANCPFLGIQSCEMREAFVCDFIFKDLENSYGTLAQIFCQIHVRGRCIGFLIPCLGLEQQAC